MSLDVATKTLISNNNGRLGLLKRVVVVVMMKMASFGKSGLARPIGMMKQRRQDL